MEDFSNTDKDVFVIHTKRMIDRGALLSRYSRTASMDIRDLYHKEFETNESRGVEFYRKVFLEYGDESVSELVTAQMAVQNISNIASKNIEEIRVGLSFLEKSSRYVRYDKKINGRYLFIDPSRIGLSGRSAAEYTDACEQLFDTYTSMYDPMMETVRNMFPINNFTFTPRDGNSEIEFDRLSLQDAAIAKKSYETSVRSRVLDDLRFLLPAGTLTNLGISGNGRSFIDLVARLKYAGDPESVSLADSIYGELIKEFPGLLENAISERKQEILRYGEAVQKLTTRNIERKAPDKLVSLSYFDDRNSSLDRVISLLLYHNTSSLQGIGKIVKAMSTEEKYGLLKAIGDLRKNRRMKPPRAFESVNYVFEVNTNFGAFRDLQRHRFLSIIRNPLSARYGYEIPDIIGSVDRYRRAFTTAMERARAAYDIILDESDPTKAQYVVPYAYRYPVAVTANLREITYFIELRSTPQAHNDLRRISIEMYNRIRSVHPELSEIIRFADEGQYDLGRLKSETRKERKIIDYGER
ncbi:MAG: FAD-dependent thymidylate synthase [Thermoplasmataceae archaeon]